MSIALLRRPIARLIGKITTLLDRAKSVSGTAGPVSLAMELADEIREVNAKDEPDKANASETDAVESERVARLLGDDPRSAVLLSFIDVEIAARDAVLRKFPDADRRVTTSFMQCMRRLQDELDPVVAKGARYLSTLRNQVIHGERLQIEPDEAAHYVALAAEVQTAVQRL